MLRLIVAISVLLGLCLAETGCQDGWFLSGDKKKCYQFVETPATFKSAQKSCAKLGGKLASVHSKAENTVLNAADEHFWLGGQDSFDNGTWSWTDGSRFGYTNWAAGEPSNVAGRNCLIVDDITLLWSSNECTRNASYFCEMTPSSIPSNQPGCPSGAKCAGNYAYSYYPVKSNWSTAESYCKSIGGHLASIHNDEVNSIVFSYQEEYDAVWVGGYIARTGMLDWSDGTLSDYVKWLPGWNSGHMSKTCVTVTVLWEGNDFEKGWQIYDCGDELTAVCEVLLTSTTVGPSTTFNPSACPFGSTCYGDYSYFYYDIKGTWKQAEDMCNSLDGHLASIHNQEVEKIAFGYQDHYDALWIGGRLDKKGNLTWSDGSPVDYSKWLRGTLSGSLEFDCATITVLWDDDAQEFKKGWAAYDCNDTFTAICEIPRQHVFEPVVLY
ncbi:hypothetical protein QR680_018635 [Steinernema hermaphroditum]|uniref:C-type lectin domain-containing protein n=1 Tax=Steinernema hermaphroditum TaxID=289476 RepID=A0AA39HKP7_9BILA|nr:hypothetical protein QR680_018635 [Steinernema hermaphroditum]